MTIWKRLFRVEDTYFANVLGFLAICLFGLGIFSIFIRQPATWYDEEIHYVRSIQIANGDILRTVRGDNTQYGGDISNTQDNFISTAFRSKLFDKEIEAIDSNWLKHYDSLVYSVKKVYRVSVTAVSYMPFQYFPYSLVVFLNKFLQLNTGVEFLLMRLSGFSWSFFLMLLAARYLPFGKLTLLLLALCPPFFLSMASITADSFVFGIISLFIAYSLYLIYKVLDRREKMSSKELLYYGFISFGLVFAKPPAALLAALILPLIVAGLHHRKFSKKQVTYLFLLLLALIFITVFWLFIVRQVDGSQYFGVASNTSQQLAFLFNQPKEALGVLIHSMVTYDFFGLQLGYAENPVLMQLPRTASIFAVLAIILSVFIGEKRLNCADTWARWFVRGLNGYKALGFTVIVLLTFFILFIQFTPVGSSQIEGVQPRYFLPYWLLVVSVLPRKTFLNKPLIFSVLVCGLVPVVYYLFFAYMQL